MSGRKETVFETVFFWSVKVCLKPWTVLCQADLQRYLFFWRERYVFVVFGEKNCACGHHLSQHSMDGNESMGFDVTQLTQDVEQSCTRPVGQPQVDTQG